MLKINRLNTSLTVGVALGGGGALGSAHIGVLKKLEEMQLPITCMSGTSIGAVISALYVFGKPLEDIYTLARKMSWDQASKFKLSRFAFATNSELGDLMIEQLGDVNIEDAPKPLAIVATDIETGKAFILKKGNLARAIMASTAIPGVFEPVVINDRKLLDGMLCDNSSMLALNELNPEFKIAVDLSARDQYKTADDVFEILHLSFDIAKDTVSQWRLEAADFVFAPNLTQYSATKTENAADLYNTGYATARTEIARLQKALQEKKKESAWYYFGKRNY